MNPTPVGPECSRREFLHQATLAASLCVVPAVRGRAEPVGRRPLFTGVGITASLDRAVQLKACGADFVVESVGRFLVPDRPDGEFEPWREKAARSVLPVLGCNSFLRDRRLRCTGPDADHPRVLAFAGTAFRRLQLVGGKYIVFGSNTARQLPPDWPKARADEQFVALLQAMGPLAAEHGITVAVEAQQASECNYLNHLAEVTAVVVAANQPAIRVLADIFHMARMGDTPADLARAMPWVSMVELAEKANRTPPGVAGDDFRPYFAVLAAAGYSGPMDIEADGTPEQLKVAFATIARQVAEASPSHASHEQPPAHKPGCTERRTV